MALSHQLIKILSSLATELAQLIAGHKYSRGRLLLKPYPCLLVHKIVSVLAISDAWRNELFQQLCPVSFLNLKTIHISQALFQVSNSVFTA
jgi:hypothetical protein|eukprot:COSAG01_NODE_18136_length_1098_cov_1.270270_2_plen_91_part_00